MGMIPRMHYFNRCRLASSVLFAWIILLGCDASSQTVEPPPKDAVTVQANQSESTTLFESRNATVEIELAMGSGVLFTDAVRINGINPGFFLIDTGANVTVIAPSVSQKLGVKPGQESFLVEGRVVGGIAKVEFSVGPLKIKQHPISIVDISPIQKFSKPVAGILGADVLQKIPFTLDYRQIQLILYDPSRFVPPQEAKAFDLLIVKPQSGPGLADSDDSVGTPAVMGEVNGLEVTMKLDTGMNQWVCIGREDASKQPDRIGRPVPPHQEVIVVGRQKSPMLLFEVNQLDLLGKSWQHLSDTMTPVPSSITQWMPDDLRLSAVGGNILREFRLTFDMPHRRLWVAQASLPHIANDKIEEKNFAGFLPVVEALKHGDLQMLKLLLASGASMSFRDESGYNLLHTAVFGGSTQCLEMLLSTEGHPKLSEAASDGMTPLILAAFLGKPDMVEIMLKAGADPNMQMTSGYTALHAASQAGCLPAAKLLLKAGANPGKSPADGQPPMAAAAQNGDVKMMQLLVDSGASLDWTASNGGGLLHFAAAGGSTDILQLALARLPKTAVDHTANQGETPLMIAADQGNIAFVRGLIEAGADANKKTKVHKTLGAIGAIHSAALNKRYEVVQYLLQNGVPPDQTTGRGLTPLMLSAGKGDTASVHALLKAGARVNETDIEKVTALHYAAKKSQPAVIPLLIKSGANVSAPAAMGVRPLDFAALMGGDKDVIRLLVEAGADPMEKGEHGLSAIDLAKQQGHQDAAKYLERLSAQSRE